MEAASPLTDPDYVWQPLSINESASLFAAYGRPWWIAGGWAIDLFVGRTTRAHGDIDLATLRRDQGGLWTLLRDEWDVHVADSGSLTPWDGLPLVAPQHQFWVRRRGAGVWAFEVLLEDTDGDEWVYRRDERVRAPLTALGRQTDGGVPYLAPEIALHYKSNRADVDRNAADFDVVAPLLDADARRWLRGAVAVASPEHPWIARLR